VKKKSLPEPWKKNGWGAIKEGGERLYDPHQRDWNTYVGGKQVQKPRIERKEKKKIVGKGEEPTTRPLPTPCGALGEE